MTEHSPSCRVLGSVRVGVDAREVKVAAPRQRALLAMLLLDANRTVSAAALIDGIWGEAPPQHPESALHIVVCRLRQVLDSVAHMLARLLRAGRASIAGAPGRNGRVAQRGVFALRAPPRASCRYRRLDRGQSVARTTPCSSNGRVVPQRPADRGARRLQRSAAAPGGRLRRRSARRHPTTSRPDPPTRSDTSRLPSARGTP
jgi:hypothetical protein